MSHELKEIFIAGGCFWGVEKYFSLIHGVTNTNVGYANGTTKNPTYKQVCTGTTGYAETVKVTYSPCLISLDDLLELYYEIIDPISVNKQANDRGTQYRTGIYYTHPEDEKIIEASLDRLAKKIGRPVAIEMMPLKNYYHAEDYHQKYLEKNPGGYCHISNDMYDKAERSGSDKTVYEKRDDEYLKRNLTQLQYAVTRQNATEPPFNNEYNDHDEQGIYVDITSGCPLFSSTDKFDSGCGWPSFTKAVSPGFIKTLPDYSHDMIRTEVRSAIADSHLGHLFKNEPGVPGQNRYCINSAALRFIPKEQMEKEGYKDYLYLFD